MIPELYVILFSDISINELLLKNTPVHITLWVHRYSLISVFAAAAVIFMLIFKIRNANYYSAILLTLFLVTSLSLLGQPPVEEAERIVERIEYNDEAYGLFAEKIFHILLYIYEIFLLYVLL